MKKLSIWEVEWAAWVTEPVGGRMQIKFGSYEVQFVLEKSKQSVCWLQIKTDLKSQPRTRSGGGCGRDGCEAQLGSWPTTHQLKNPNCLHPPPTTILPQGRDQLDLTKNMKQKWEAGPTGQQGPQPDRRARTLGEMACEQGPSQATSPSPKSINLAVTGSIC